MAKHVAKCPKCGSRVDLDTAVGARIICANCQASLSLPGKGKGPSEADPLVGKSLGEFEVAELLSRDRFGAVYRARQPSLDRLVLLRVLEGARAADAELAEALKQRARAAAGIHHGNVIQILAVGEAEGLPFVTTEHAEGETLAAVLSRGGLLSPAWARQYLKEAASALAAVHEAGIVHGHIRPANILIDLKGTARLSSLDLPAQGVAGETGAREDVPLGALIYAAPEVISGMTPGAAADLYSLGATFYHLLAGRPPHECETASELATKHITETPPLLARIAPKADRRLTRIIDRLICKSPSARAPSAQALVEELETLGPLRADAPRAAPPREPVAQAPAPHAGEAEKMVHTQRRGPYVPVRLLVRGAVVVGLIVGIICLWRVIVGQWKAHERGPTARATGAEAEEAASKLLEKTKACIEQQDWETAAYHLGRLERFAETSFYGEHHEEILNLRRTATAEADAARKAEMEGEASGADGKGRSPRHPTVAGKKLAPGFVIAYYDRPDRRRFFRAEVASRVRFEWGRGSPAQGVPDNFAAHVVGWLRIDADDRYTFRFSAVSGARLHLDGKLVLDAWDIDYLNEVARVDLGQGWHRLWIEYRNWHSGAFLMLHCARGTGERHQWWTLSDDLLYCEADLLTRVQDHPTEDPLVGREPQTVGGPVLDEPTARPTPKPTQPTVDAGDNVVIEPVGERFEETFDGPDLVNWREDFWRWDLDAGSVLAHTNGNAMLTLKRGDVADRLSDFFLEVDVMDTGEVPGGYYGVIFRRVGREFLLFRLHTSRNEARLQGHFQVEPRPGSQDRVDGVKLLIRGKRLALKAGETHRLRVVCCGKYVVCFVDDEVVAKAEDTSLLRGEVALFVHEAKVRFDNLLIRGAKLRPEPTAKEREELWLRRAERRSKRLPFQNDLTRLLAWSDVLEACPDATGATLTRAREQRDQYAKAVAERWGLVTARTRRLALEVLNAGKVREWPDGRLRIDYPGRHPKELSDWKVEHGFMFLSSAGGFRMPRRAHALNAMSWTFRHGDDVTVQFQGEARRTIGCTIFGVPGDPLGSGIQMVVSNQPGSFSTVGIAGQEPLWRSQSRIITSLPMSISVSKGELVCEYPIRLAGGRLQRQEVVRRQIDVEQFQGRSIILWTHSRPSDDGRANHIGAMSITTRPQNDWIGRRLVMQGLRFSDRPGPDGWLGLEYPGAHARTVWWRNNHVWTWGHTYAVKAATADRWRHVVMQRGAVRDCVISARYEFLPGAGEGAESFGLLFRVQPRMHHVIALPRFGRATLARWARGPGGRLNSDELADSQAAVPRRSVQHIMAIIQGKRIEVYANGSHLLTHRGLSDESGKVGFEVRRATVLVHDFKFRLLPSDPNYEKIYGKKGR